MIKLEPFNTKFAMTGRVVMGLYFLLSGLSKLMDTAGTAGYIESVGLPVPMLLAWCAVIFESALGLALITGYYAKCAALLLTVFVFVLAFLFHGPGTWEEAPLQKISFMKNIALAAGLLFMTAHLNEDKTFGSRGGGMNM